MNFSAQENYTLNQQGCSIPRLELFSDDVMPFYGKEPDLFCDRNTSPLFTEDTRFLYFNASALSAYGSKGVVCSYSSFERKEGAEDEVK